MSTVLENVELSGNAIKSRISGKSQEIIWKRMAIRKILEERKKEEKKHKPSPWSNLLIWFGVLCSELHAKYWISEYFLLRNCNFSDYWMINPLREKAHMSLSFRVKLMAKIISHIRFHLYHFPIPCHCLRPSGQSCGGHTGS